MIRPNMATMLGFVATDAAVAPALLRAWSGEAADRSFNRITDRRRHLDQRLVRPRRQRRGRQRAGEPVRQRRRRALRDAVIAPSPRTRAGHRARRRGREQVHHGAGRGAGAARLSAASWPTRSPHSPLVRPRSSPAIPTSGRILAAVGYAGIADLDQTTIDLDLGDVAVVRARGRLATYREEDGQRVMNAPRSRSASA